MSTHERVTNLIGIEAEYFLHDEKDEFVFPPEHDSFPLLGELRPAPGASRGGSSRIIKLFLSYAVLLISMPTLLGAIKPGTIEHEEHEIKFGNAMSDDLFFLYVQNISEGDITVTKITLKSECWKRNEDRINIFIPETLKKHKYVDRASIVINNEQKIELIKNLQFILKLVETESWEINPVQIIIRSNNNNIFRLQFEKISTKRKGKYNFIVTCTVDSESGFAFGWHLYQYGYIFEKNTKWVESLNILVGFLEESK